MKGAADVVAAVGLVLVLLAVWQLAGVWWAVGVAGVALLWVGFVLDQQRKLRARDDRKAT